MFEKITGYFKKLFGTEPFAPEPQTPETAHKPATENIITVTERALEKIKTLHQTKDVSGRSYLRLIVTGYNATGYVSRLEITNPFEKTEGTTIIFESDELVVYSNRTSAFYLRDKEIDFEENPKPSFVIRNLNNNANGNYFCRNECGV